MDPTDLRRGLVVLCQAHEDHPLRDPYVISVMAACAERGGAAGIRADGPRDIRSIRERVSLPILGILRDAASRTLSETSGVERRLDQRTLQSPLKMVPAAFHNDTNCRVMKGEGAGDSRMGQRQSP